MRSVFSCLCFLLMLVPMLVHSTCIHCICCWIFIGLIHFQNFFEVLNQLNRVSLLISQTNEV